MGVRFRTALTLLLVALLAGCGMVQSVTRLPGETLRAFEPRKEEKQTVDAVTVLQMLLRFADEYLTGMTIQLDKLQQGPNRLDLGHALRWKVALGTETCSIASGANAVVGVLDMTVFVTLTRMELEERWSLTAPEDSTPAILEYARQAETKVWRLAGGVLTPAQADELRQAIEARHRKEPLPGGMLGIRSWSFASLGQADRQAAAVKPDSVFGLLGLDPLAGMDPAVREIAETRLFAERALFVTQKMPTLLRWQTELLSVNTLTLPEVEKLLADSSRIASSADRFASVSEKLPGQISSEREALVAALEAQEATLAPLVQNARETLRNGAEMSTSLNTTIATFDALMKRFGIGEPKTAAPAVSGGEPFRIQDYTASAAQFEAMARQLTELLVTLDQTTGANKLSELSAQVAPAIEKAQAGSKAIVDYAFWRGVLLVAIAFAAALLYRLLGRLLWSAKRSPNAP